MYYVVRSGVPFSLERAMASAGAAAVECVERFRADERWRERPRKVALRADGVRFRNEIITGPGGQQILLEDPSGNPIELFQPAAR